MLDILQSTFCSYVQANKSQSCSTKRRSTSKVRQLAVKGFGLDQIWAQIEHHTGSVNEKLISQLSALMADEHFMREALTTDDQHSKSDLEEGPHSSQSEGIGAEYGSEDDSQDGYKFEKEGEGEGEDDLLDVE